METDKYIEVTDGNFVTTKQTGKAQINMCGDTGKPFILTLYNVLFTPALCNQLFSIMMLINLVHIYLFNKGFCTVLFGANEHNAVILGHSAQRKNAFLVKTKEKSKS